MLGLVGRALHRGQPGGALGGHFNFERAGQVAPGQRLGVGLDLLKRALRHHPPAVHTGARAHVDHVVGGAHHVFVVFHHQHTVADVAQVFERVNQPVVVALVQADAGFVQHIHHTGQARTNLAGQANALRFAAAQCLGATIQAQVVQAHVVQKLQAQANLAHHLGRNLPLGAVHAQGAEVGIGLAQRAVADLKNRTGLIAFADLDVAGLGAQARATTLRAGLGAAHARQVFAYQVGVGLLVAALHIGDDALEGVLFAHLFARRHAGVGGIVEADFFRARAVQNGLAHRLGQRLKGLLHVKLVVLGQALKHGEVIGVAPIPPFDGAAGQAQAGEGDHARRVKQIMLAQAVAGRAGAHRRVERKQARLQLADGIAAARAGKFGIKAMLQPGRSIGGGIHLQRNSAAIGQAQRGFKTLGQALLKRVVVRALGVGGAAAVAGVGGQWCAHLDAVYHHINVVLLGFLERGQFVKLKHLAIDAKAHIALGLHLGKQLYKLAFFLARHRGHDHQARAFGHGQHRVHHLAHGLRLQGLAVLGAVGCACAGKQQAQVVVDLGHRAHGGARVVAGGFLLDGDGRRQAFNQVHIGLVHQLQKLARVGGQAFYITALAFGIQRVKGQAGLARAAQARDHHQLVARNIEVDVFEVVGACPAHTDQVLAQCGTQVGAGRLIEFASQVKRDVGSVHSVRVGQNR